MNRDHKASQVGNLSLGTAQLIQTQAVRYHAKGPIPTVQGRRWAGLISLAHTKGHEGLLVETGFDFESQRAAVAKAREIAAEIRTLDLPTELDEGDRN